MRYDHRLRFGFVSKPAASRIAFSFILYTSALIWEADKLYPFIAKHVAIKDAKTQADARNLFLIRKLFDQFGGRRQNPYRKSAARKLPCGCFIKWKPTADR